MVELWDEEIPRLAFVVVEDDEVLDVTEVDSLFFGDAETRMVVVLAFGIGIPISFSSSRFSLTGSGSKLCWVYG